MDKEGRACLSEPGPPFIAEDGGRRIPAVREGCRRTNRPMVEAGSIPAIGVSMRMTSEWGYQEGGRIDCCPSSVFSRPGESPARISCVSPAREHEARNVINGFKVSQNYGLELRHLGRAGIIAEASSEVRTASKPLWASGWLQDDEVPARLHAGAPAQVVRLEQDVPQPLAGGDAPGPLVAPDVDGPDPGELPPVGPVSRRSGCCWAGPAR